MKKYYLAFVLLVGILVHAQNPAAVDLFFHFKSNKIALDGDIKNSFVQPDGKIVIWGSFTKYRIGSEYFNCNNIVRLNSDLTLDDSFTFGQNYTGTINGVGMQSTGKLVISTNYGFDYFYNGTLLTRIFRLNTDGSLDTSFIGFNSGSSIFGITSTDQILYRSSDTITTRRLNSNGTQDFTYTPTGSGFTVYDLQADGSILFSSGAGALSSINSNGTYALDYATTVNCGISSIDKQADGKILIGGSFSHTASLQETRQLLRLNTDGTIDNTFTSLGFDWSAALADGCQTSVVNFLQTQPDGKIVVAGMFSAYGGTPTKKIIRLNANGSLDTTFNPITEFTTTNVSLLKVLPNGNILVGTYNQGGTIPTLNTYEVTNLFTLDANGNLTNEDKSVDSKITTILKNNNNLVLLGERRAAYHRGIKLVDGDGSMIFNQNLLDAFDANPSFGGTTVSVLTGAVQPDGKFLLGGAFSKYNGNAVTKLVRLNSDFTIDASFNLGTGFSRITQPEVTNIEQIVLQPDGKIIVSGQFNIFNGQSFPGGTIRLNTNGSLDASFNFAGAYPLSKIILLANGKLLGGDAFSIKRYEANGTVDASFAAITNYGDAFDVQSNGKIVNGSARFNSDGSADSSFYDGGGISPAYAVKVQPDDKILVGGYDFARFNADGTPDEAFNTGGGFNNAVRSIVLDDSGRILVGGEFTRYNGAWCIGVIRLVGGNCFVIRGTNRFDADNNGCDENDITFPNMKLKITNGLNTTDLIPDTTGDYAATVSPGNYTVTPILPNGAFTVSPGSFTVTFPAASNPTVQDFCLTSSGIHPDLEVQIIPITVARPGFNAKYKIIYKNKGNQLQSGSVNLSFDDALINLVSASPAASQSGGNLSWNFTNLLPLAQREIAVTLLLHSPTQIPALNAGSVLDYTASVISTLTDDTPSDNTITFHQIVVNSFDPNDKTCLEGATIGTTQVGDYVHYVIRFENKGTYNAQNISVKDVIDTSKFDINTLTPMAGSERYVTKITDGNKVEFYFEDINLPFADATNDGYVAFKIKTKSTLVAGDTFSNNAAIYFDYNVAVNTNTATTAVGVLATRDFAFENYFTVYPNPANSQLNIVAKQTIAVTSIEIYNTLGQLVIAIPQNTPSIDVSGLKAGNYFIRINSQQGTSTTKFIKL